MLIGSLFFFYKVLGCWLCFEPFKRNGLSRFLAVAKSAVFNSLKGIFYLLKLILTHHLQSCIPLLLKLLCTHVSGMVVIISKFSHRIIWSFCIVYPAQISFFHHL